MEPTRAQKAIKTQTRLGRATIRPSADVDKETRVLLHRVKMDLKKQRRAKQHEKHSTPERARDLGRALSPGSIATLNCNTGSRHEHKQERARRLARR